MSAKGYWIVQVTVKDAANYPRYIAADALVFGTHSARFLVRGGRY